MYLIILLLVNHVMYAHDYRCCIVCFYFYVIGVITFDFQYVASQYRITRLIVRSLKILKV